MKHNLLYYPLIVHLILLFIVNEHPLIMNTHRITNTTSFIVLSFGGDPTTGGDIRLLTMYSKI